MTTSNISTTYKTVLESSNKICETNDCGVISMSIATGKSYEECHKAFKKAGRKDRRGVGLGMIENVLQQFGFNNEIKVCATEFGKRITVNQAGKYLKDGNYIAVTRNHALAIVNGVPHDWTEGRRHQVKFFYKVS